MPHRNIKALDVNALTAGEHDCAMHSAPRLIAAPVQHQLHLYLRLTLPEPVCSNQLILAHRLLRLTYKSVHDTIEAFCLKNMRIQGQEYAGTASRLQTYICQDGVHTMLPEASVLKNQVDSIASCH